MQIQCYSPVGGALQYENPRVSGFDAQNAAPEVRLNCVEMKDNCAFYEDSICGMLPCVIV